MTVGDGHCNLLEEIPSSFGFRQCVTLFGYDSTQVSIPVSVNNADSGASIVTATITSLSAQATQNQFAIVWYAQSSAYAVVAPRGGSAITSGWSRFIFFNGAATSLNVDFYTNDANNNWFKLAGPILQGANAFLDEKATSGSNWIQVRDTATGSVYAEGKFFNDDNTWLADQQVLFAFVGQQNSNYNLQIFSDPNVSGAAALVASWAVIAFAAFALMF
jgi:hypothetical protein